jgi:glycosyltransferase involved in cell wall biosynthesis
MTGAERTVLHVLPHPGGGGETYVDVLGSMRGYRFTRVYLARTRAPKLTELTAGLVRAYASARDHDVVHVHGEVAGGLCLPLLASRPSVATLHGLHLLRRLDGWRRQTSAMNLRAILRAAGRTICVSRAEHEELRAAVHPSQSQRAVVVHNGVQLPDPPTQEARSEVRRELEIDDGDPLAMWLGALDERRDPLAVVRGARETDTTLVVVGDGPLRPLLEREAAASTRFLGHRVDVSRLLAAADFYVLMSRREGLSFSLLEAMAHGLPAIVSDLPENVEAVGETGIPVPSGDEQELAVALRRLAGDEQERHTLGESARRRIRRLFDARDMVERTEAVYDHVLSERRR